MILLQIFLRINKHNYHSTNYHDYIQRNYSLTKCHNFIKKRILKFVAILRPTIYSAYSYLKSIENSNIERVYAT